MRHLRLVTENETKLREWVTLRLAKFNPNTRNYHQYKDQVWLLDAFDNVIGSMPYFYFLQIEAQVINELTPPPPPNSPSSPIAAKVDNNA